MGSNLYPILVDNREKIPSPNERVAELRYEGADASVGFLDAGDYRWVVTYDDGRPSVVVIVERKTVRDLVASIDDGRLAHFVDITGGPQGTEGVARYLFIEGDTNVYLNVSREWTPEQLDGVLVSAQHAGLIIVRSSAASRTAKRLVSLWRYTGREDHQSLLRVVRVPISDNYLNPDKKAAVRAVMGLPGWGEQRAREAIRVFGSPREVIAAVTRRDYKAFKDVRGVAKKLVDDAADFLERTV